MSNQTINDANYDINSDPDITRANDGNRRFNTIEIDLGTLFANVKEGRYDMNPPWQRNVIMANDKKKWQSGILYSLMYGPQIAEPEFDTQRENGIEKLRSLDGKQRVMAIVDYMDGNFKYSCDEPKIMHNRTFSELPDAVKSWLEGVTINIKKCRDRLTDEEVSRFFEIKQFTTATKLGERLDAWWYHPIMIWANQLYTTNRDLLEEMSPRSIDRKTPLELLILLSKVIITGKYDDKQEKVIKWVKSTTNEDIENIHNDKIIDIFRIISTNLSVNCGKNNVIPISYLYIINYEERMQVKSFLIDNMTDDFFSNMQGLSVAGAYSAKAVNKKIDLIKRKYEEWQQ